MLAIVRYRYTLIATPNMIRHAEQVARQREQQWLREEAILLGKKHFPLCRRCGIDSQVIYCQKLESTEEAFHCVNCHGEVKP